MIYTAFCFLSVVTDYYTKEIIGHSVGETLETKYPQEALEMAISHYGGRELSGLIHHSDRGVQYASYAYTARLKDLGIRISMTPSQAAACQGELRKRWVSYRERAIKRQNEANMTG